MNTNAKSGTRRWKRRSSRKPSTDPGQKNRACLRRRITRAGPDEGGGNDIGRIPFQPARAVARERKAAPELENKAQDPLGLPRIQALATKRPTYGHRRISALQNRGPRAESIAAVHHKRGYCIMQRPLRLERSDDGKALRCSNLRWCSDGLEFTSWNGGPIRLAFLIDAHDREIISWRAIAKAGNAGDTATAPSDRPERFGRHRAGTGRSPARQRPMSLCREDLAVRVGRSWDIRRIGCPDEDARTGSAVKTWSLP